VVFIVVQCKANVILFEPTLYEKARLARSFSNVFRAPGAEALTARGQRPLAPALPVAIDGLRHQIVTDASLSQLITDLQGTQPARCPLNDETLRESLVREETLGLERVQDFADKGLRKTSPGELAAKLGARVLAARE
jgi:Mg-chelatase subunit ChlD